MAWAGIAVACVLIVVIFVDTFESIMVPRRIRHGLRFSRQYYRLAWIVWRSTARLAPRGWPRQGYLSAFGPLSLLGLLSLWATGLIAGFALLHGSLGTALSAMPDESLGPTTFLYFSGTTFLTLGYGDIVPTRSLGRALSVIEAGVGFGFLAVVLSYLPVLYQAFARREITISLLDARAGSPPTAGELLRRSAVGGSWVGVDSQLVEWEHWAAELLESHVSFPVLRYYRSQHDNQSWLAALTTILDAAAVLMAGVDGANDRQARLTFAVARHAAVDLGLVSEISPVAPQSDRLPSHDLARLHGSLREAGLRMRDEATMGIALAELRGLYEPFINALAEHLRFELPPFLPSKPPVDNWQRSPRMQPSPGLGDLAAAQPWNEQIH